MYYITFHPLPDDATLDEIPIFPTLLNMIEYSINDITSCLKALISETRERNAWCRIGDSALTVIVSRDDHTHTDAVTVMEPFAKSFMHHANVAMPGMSKQYREFYEKILYDYQHVGIKY